ncbi:hypothetical protein [Dactylosporangium sp. NPDC000521]|uniref:hypothetical protein n=1 Tax=Dactylosporangium sp. NPDC000521 TaxID=3363975 RepID=UPI0036964799
MNALLEQTPALAGVVVGALLSFVLSAFAERTRWRRDEAVRWDAERMRVYADYGLAVRDMYRVVLSVASHHGYGDHPAQPDRPPDAGAALAAAEAQRAARFEAVLLLGNPATVAAARRWHQAVWHLECFARGRLTDPAGWPPARREFGLARAEYYRAARHDLGITGALPSTVIPAWQQSLRQGRAGQ